MQVEPIEMKVSFSLPEWFPSGRNEEAREKAIDALMSLPEVEEHTGIASGWNPFPNIIVFRFDVPADPAKKLAEVQARLTKFLRRYKEGRAAQ